jgi:hypothetical protein
MQKILETMMPRSMVLQMMKTAGVKKVQKTTKRSTLLVEY